ncbi:MAG: hypothetical protein V2A54_10625 [Bacteroidota bacterium]
MKNLHFVSLFVFVCFMQTITCAQNPIMIKDTAGQKFLIDSLVKTIDDNYDILHSDFTPSVHKLSTMGIPAIEAVLPLLNSSKEDTRLHAQRVVEGVIYRMNGFVPGQGFTTKGGEEKSREILNSIEYDWEGIDLKNRQNAIENLKKWISKNK